MIGGSHWKSRRGRPKKPPPPAPALDCSRCKNLRTTKSKNVRCALGFALDASTCGSFRDCSTNPIRPFFSMIST